MQRPPAMTVLGVPDTSVKASARLRGLDRQPFSPRNPRVAARLQLSGQRGPLVIRLSQCNAHRRFVPVPTSPPAGYTTAASEYA